MKYDDYLVEISDLYKDGESSITISEIMANRYPDLKWYPMKISRILNKAESKGLVEIRSISEAQKIALDKGRAEHPTEGKERSEEEKEAIKNGMANYLDSLSEEEMAERNQKIIDAVHERWENMDDKERSAIISNINSAKVGVSRSGCSKVETAIYKELCKRGLPCVPKYVIERSGMEIDIMMSYKGKQIAIEVDGPTHFRPIYGEENLKKVIEKDTKKDIILKESGFYIIRVRDRTSSVSKRRIEGVVDSIMNVAEKPEKQNYVEF